MGLCSQAANMGGVESLFEDMLREDVEYQKLKTVKGLTDITDFRDKYIVATEDFKCVFSLLGPTCAMTTIPRLLQCDVADTLGVMATQQNSYHSP